MNPKIIALNNPIDYVKILDEASDPLVTLNSDYQFTYANKAFAQALGKPLETIIGNDLWGVYQKDGADFRRDVTKEVFETGQIKIVDNVVPKPSGNLYFITTFKPIFNEQNIVISVVAIAKDITDRKRAEDELKNMARFPSENPNPVLRIAKDGTLLYMNQAGFSLLPELHLQVGQAVPRKLRDAAHQAISNGSTQSLELELGQRLFSFILGPVVTAGYVNLYADDITELKRAANALDEERRRLQQALDEVRTLRGIVPICANCKKIRDDKGFWNQVEKYVSERTEAEFSHGVCPDCAKKLYPDIYKEKKIKDMERSVILLVDDEEDFRMIFIRKIKQILKDQEFEFIEASDGEEALELLKRGAKLSIIILDYAMPKINGMELLKRIDSDHNYLYDVPRIMISGYTQKEIISEAQRLRCVFFEKSMDNIFYQQICQYMTNTLVDLVHKKGV